MPYNVKYNGTIADSLTPTIENVVREFIETTIYSIVLDDKKISFNFDFRQTEALDFIEKLIYEDIKKYEHCDWYPEYKNKFEKLVKNLKVPNSRNSNLPTLIVNDYKCFFELLRQYYENVIELYFKRTKMSGFPVYEMKNCFEEIWLRATPEDFNNPEYFLQKQVQIISDTTFEKYDTLVEVGSLDFLDNNILCVKNGIARTWDETPREFEMKIFNKEDHYKADFYNKNCYIFPVVRYGIYERNGKKVCLIGSIQTKDDGYSNQITKSFNRIRYKINKNIPGDDIITNVEPSHLIALSIFVNFLHQEGITEIEVPSFYVLDYQYHQKLNITLAESFFKEWDEYRQEKYPDVYLEQKKILKSKLNKEELISKIKTEKFIETFIRLAYHYPKSKIYSYAGDVDNYLHMEIPITKSLADINGELLQSLYTSIDEMYKNHESHIFR